MIACCAGWSLSGCVLDKWNDVLEVWLLVFLFDFHRASVRVELRLGRSAHRHVGLVWVLDLFVPLKKDLVVLDKVWGMSLKTLYFTICVRIYLLLLLRRLCCLNIEIFLSAHKWYEPLILGPEPRSYSIIASTSLPLFKGSIHYGWVFRYLNSSLREEIFALLWLISPDRAQKSTALIGHTLV